MRELRFGYVGTCVCTYNTLIYHYCRVLLSAQTWGTIESPCFFISLLYSNDVRKHRDTRSCPLQSIASVCAFLTLAHVVFRTYGSRYKLTVGSMEKLAYPWSWYSTLGGKGAAGCDTRLQQKSGVFFSLLVERLLTIKIRHNRYIMSG